MLSTTVVGASETGTAQVNKKDDAAASVPSPYRFPAAYSYTLTTVTQAGEHKTKLVSRILVTPTKMRTESEVGGVKSINITDYEAGKSHYFMDRGKQGKMHFASPCKKPNAQEQKKAAALSTWKKLETKDKLEKWQETTKLYTTIHWMRPDGVPVRSETTYRPESGGAKATNEWTSFKKLEEKSIDPKLFEHPQGYKSN